MSKSVKIHYRDFSFCGMLSRVVNTATRLNQAGEYEPCRLDMDARACIDVLKSVPGPLRLYLYAQNPINYGFKSVTHKDLMHELSYNRGPIKLIKPANDSKTEKRVLIFFGNGNYCGSDISLDEDENLSCLVIANYIVRYGYRNTEISCFSRLEREVQRAFMNVKLSDELIPKEPSEKWPGQNNTGETLIDFIVRVWGHYIPYGLRLSHFKTRDIKLWNAIYNYRKNNEWPRNLYCLSQRDSLRESVEIFGKDPNKLDPKALVAVARKIQREKIKSEKLDTIESAPSRPALKSRNVDPDNRKAS